MTQEEKELLLKDLYARLSYGVIVRVEHDWFENEVPPYDCKLSIKSHKILDDFCKSPLFSELIIKPYLRPMSNMTEDEKEELRTLKWTKLEHYTVDWLNEHHFDYRGLIEKGLALEAPKGMYNIQ